MLPFTDATIHRCDHSQMRIFTDAPIYRCYRSEMPPFTDAPIHRCYHSQMLPFTDATASLLSDLFYSVFKRRRHAFAWRPSESGTRARPSSVEITACRLCVIRPACSLCDLCAHQCANLSANESVRGRVHTAVSTDMQVRAGRPRVCPFGVAGMTDSLGLDTTGDGKLDTLASLVGSGRRGGGGRGGGGGGVYGAGRTSAPTPVSMPRDEGHAGGRGATPAVCKSVSAEAFVGASPLLGPFTGIFPGSYVGTSDTCNRSGRNVAERVEEEGYVAPQRASSFEPRGVMTKSAHAVEGESANALDLSAEGAGNECSAGAEAGAVTGRGAGGS
eukprot:6177078-Pleurochrysis_carterae.AAC.1